MGTRLILVDWITGTWKTGEELEISNFQQEQWIPSDNIKEPVYK